MARNPGYRVRPAPQPSFEQRDPRWLIVACLAGLVVWGFAIVGFDAVFFGG